MSPPGLGSAALSPLDGRYADAVAPLAQLFSEHELIWQRWQIELAWLAELARLEHCGPSLSATQLAALDSLRDIDRDQLAAQVKRLELETRHDVKALELALAGQLARLGLGDAVPWVHFACTSWDINNLAYATMLRCAQQQVLCPALEQLQAQLNALACDHADTAMLGHTHGQPASPTTFGKEMRVYEHRLRRQLEQLAAHVFDGKFNGATGNYSAHCIAAPTLDWPLICRRFVERQQLRCAGVTTQIEPYDGMVEFFNCLTRINCILLDLAQDASAYAALGYLQLRQGEKTVGSSTMPHKINPLRFENAEGNLQMANCILQMFALKLPVSRLQRDLSDSTMLRNVGVALGHSYLAWGALRDGLDSITVNRAALQADLDGNWQVLAEAVQTALRAAGDGAAYDKLKLATRQAGALSRDDYLQVVARCVPPGKLRDRLERLRPQDYVGLAVKLAVTGCADKTTSSERTAQQSAPA